MLLTGQKAFLKTGKVPCQGQNKRPSFPCLQGLLEAASSHFVDLVIRKSMNQLASLVPHQVMAKGRLKLSIIYTKANISCFLSYKDCRGHPWAATWFSYVVV